MGKDKKKKKEDAAPAPEAEAPPAASDPEPEPAPPAEGGGETAPEAPPSKTPSKSSKKSKSSRRSSRRSKRSGSPDVFSVFSQNQVHQFKTGFSFLDWDKDGFIGKADLKKTFDKVYKMVSDQDLENMLAEATENINFNVFINMYAARMSGPLDEDDIVIEAFKTFDFHGLIDGAKFRRALTSWGDTFTDEEVDTIYGDLVINDNGYIDTEDLLDTIVGAHEGED